MAQRNFRAVWRSVSSENHFHLRPTTCFSEGCLFTEPGLEPVVGVNPSFPVASLQGQEVSGQPSNSTANFKRRPPSPLVKIGSRYRKSAAKTGRRAKWTMALKNGTPISLCNILSRKTGLPLFPAEASQKGMFHVHSLFKGGFRKPLSIMMVNNRSLVFRPIKANLPYFSSKDRDTKKEQALHITFLHSDWFIAQNQSF